MTVAELIEKLKTMPQDAVVTAGSVMRTEVQRVQFTKRSLSSPNPNTVVLS